MSVLLVTFFKLYEEVADQGEKEARGDLEGVHEQYRAPKKSNK